MECLRTLIGGNFPKNALKWAAVLVILQYIKYIKRKTSTKRKVMPVDVYGIIIYYWIRLKRLDIFSNQIHQCVTQLVTYPLFSIHFCTLEKGTCGVHLCLY